MKKILMGGVVIALVLTVGLTTVFAAGGRNYVDANGDGVCDNRGTYCRYVDANGDGVCDNYQNGGRGQGQGGRFRNTCWRMAL